MGTNGFHAHGTAWPGDVFLSALDRSLHDELWDIGTAGGHRAGDWIAEQGTSPESVAIVLSGFVKTVREARTGSRKMMVAISGPGELLGIEAHWTNKPRHAGHVFSTDGEALVVGRDDFKEFLEIPAARNAVTDTFARRTILRDASLSFANHKVRTRLLAFLSRMEFLHGKRTPQGVLLDIGLNCDDVSSAIGASIPAVTKAFKALKAEGVLTVQPKRVLVKVNLKGVLDRACATEAKAGQDKGDEHQ